MSCLSFIAAQCDFHLLPDNFIQPCFKDCHGRQEHTLSKEKYRKGRPERAFRSLILTRVFYVCDVAVIVTNSQTCNDINLAQYID